MLKPVGHIRVVYPANLNEKDSVHRIWLKPVSNHNKWTLAMVYLNKELIQNEGTEKRRP
jgi:hypothetical protein